jgi:threonylcarbamoyladenosine tRNA methylthiotransferase MtaB
MRTALYNVRPMMKRASLHTLGCRLNQAETAVLESRLRLEGYEIVEFGQLTDLLVVNTCSVTEEAERTCRYVVRKTLKHSPDAFVAVTGCYAQTGVQELRTIPGIDLIVGNQFKWDLPTFLPPAQSLQKRSTVEVFHSKTIRREDFTLPEFGEPNSTRALLKIQDGCDVMCSFCIIPFARGHERSRLVGDVLHEAEVLAAAGYQEVVLTGVNIGQYNHNGLDLVRLIDRLEAIDGIRRIRISSIEPTTVSDELLTRISSSSKLCPYLHIPLQSGDDGILSSMHRPYVVREFLSLIDRAVTRIPSLGLGTDLMVGFPGESEAAFCRTVELAHRLPFSYFHVFTYSKRPGTAAAKLLDEVPIETARRRAKTLTDLSREKRLAFAQRWIGAAVPVLFESGAIDNLRMGTTAHFLKVGVHSPSVITNQIQQVSITGATDSCALGYLLNDGRSCQRILL